MPAVVPVTDVKDLLDTNWTLTNVPKPVLLEVNHADTLARMDLANRGDYVTIRSGFPAEREVPIGNHTYGNRTHIVLIDIWTLGDRQRLYDIVAEIRRICHDQRHSMTNFQRIVYINFEELGQEDNEQVWNGQIELDLENQSIILETT